MGYKIIKISDWIQTISYASSAADHLNKGGLKVINLLESWLYCITNQLFVSVSTRLRGGKDIIATPNYYPGWGIGGTHSKIYWSFSTWKCEWVEGSDGWLPGFLDDHENSKSWNWKRPFNGSEWKIMPILPLSLPDQIRVVNLSPSPTSRSGEGTNSGFK